MAYLRVDLPSASQLWITIGPCARMDIGCPICMCRYRVRAAKQIADRICHQDADHSYLPNISMTNQVLCFSSVRGVMPWATDQKLAAMLICDLYQFLGFSNCERHWLF